MEDWAEVHRLFHREGLAKAAIARRLGMSRNTVDRLLGLAEPPDMCGARGLAARPVRRAIAAMLATDPTVRATVIRERLRPLGYRGGITILKDHLARVRPAFLAARAYQRTTYRPGEIGQVDWWHTGAQVPSGAAVTGRRSAWSRRCPSRPPTRSRSPCPGRSATCAGQTRVV